MNSLKYVIAVRPGDDEKSGELSELGKKQAEELARLIPEKLGRGTKVLVVTPPDKRALQTAQIIGMGPLKVDPRSLSSLDNRYYENGESQMKQILAVAGGYEAVVVIAHYTAPSGIINAFRRRFVGLGNKFTRERTPKGTALCLELKLGSGEVIRLPEFTPDPVD